MPCSSIALSGINENCRNSIGGIVELLIARAEDVTASTVTTTQATGTELVTAITMATGAKFYSYRGTKDSSNFVSTFTAAPESGSGYWATVVTTQWSKLDSIKRAQLKALTIDDLVLIAKDRNGKYWMIGRENPVMASNATMQTGAAAGDLNGATFEGSADEPAPPIEVDATIISGLLEAAA